MRSRNSCYTYFQISGNFDPVEISKILELKPDKITRIGELIDGRRRRKAATWEFGRCDEYNVAIENQMRTTIAPLLDKIPLLNKIREEYGVKFWISIVPTLYVGEFAPVLAPPLDVIDFCHETRTEIDIDLYLCEADRPLK